MTGFYVNQPGILEIFWSVSLQCFKSYVCELVDFTRRGQCPDTRLSTMWLYMWYSVGHRKVDSWTPDGEKAATFLWHALYNVMICYRGSNRYTLGLYTRQNSTYKRMESNRPVGPVSVKLLLWNMSNFQSIKRFTGH